MVETLLGGVALLVGCALMYRAKAHGDRAEAAVATMRRIKREVFAKLGIQDDEDRMTAPGAGSEPIEHAAQQARRQ